MSATRLSIIIPVYNEAENLIKLIPALVNYSKNHQAEIIVVDAKSTDNSLAVARESGADQVLLSPVSGRGPQMNFGAQHSRGEILYFLHADTLPPKSFCEDIEFALSQGYQVGCYRFRFDRPHPVLKINAWFTRLPLMICRGGDQSMFIKRELFQEHDGFDETYQIMEEYDFIRRVKQTTSFHIMSGEIIVSSRKYDHNSYLRVNLANLAVFMMFFLNVSQKTMVRTYQRLLDYR